MKKTLKTKVTRSETYDKMALSAKFASGGSFRYSIGRSGESWTLGASNDPVKAQEQLKVVQSFMCSVVSNMTYGQKFDAIEPILKECDSVSELIGKLNEATLKASIKKPSNN